MTKVFVVFGTRPKAIKLSQVIKELNRCPDRFVCQVCFTEQHREMIDSLLRLFIKPIYDLNIMQENQSLEHITISVMAQLVEIIKQEKPDYPLVQGDTTTAMTASLAAFYQKVIIAHALKAKQNFIREGIAEEKMEVTKNNVIEALLETAG